MNDQPVSSEARDHFHDPFDPLNHAEWLTTLGHKPLPDGRCEHRWRNRTARAVNCAFLDGFRAGLTAPATPAGPEERGEGLRCARCGSQFSRDPSKPEWVGTGVAGHCKVCGGSLTSAFPERGEGCPICGAVRASCVGVAESILSATSAPDTGAEERLRAALTDWLDSHGEPDIEDRLAEAAKAWLGDDE